MSNEPVGRVEPLVMIPRFTTYAGHNTGSDAFSSVPLDVSRFSNMTVTFWRGPLLLGGGSPTFSAQFESSHDADTWFAEGAAITTTSTISKVEIDLDRRWLRVTISLSGNPGDPMAITCWAVGSLEHRLM